MNENEFDLDGVTLVAIQTKVLGCNDCVAFHGGLCRIVMISSPSCFAEDRIDGNDVIFVEKQQ